MEIKKLQINIILFLLNFKLFVQSSTQNNNVNTLEVNNDLMSTDNPLPNSLKHEQNVNGMEEMLKTFTWKLSDQLEAKMVSVLNHNMEKLEKNILEVLEKTFEEKITNLCKILQENIKNINQTIENKRKNVEKMMENKINLLKINDNLNELKSFNETNNTETSKVSATNKLLLAPNDLETLNVGWTIIQRRQDGSENFNRNWTEYAEGFGDVNGEFFIGLNKLHNLTSSEDPYELYIILENFEGEKKYAKYGVFKIDSESNDYKLTLDDYSGEIIDSFSYHNGMKFSTIDRDNDLSDDSCAERWRAAWWYKNCFQVNLNGQYFGDNKGDPRGDVNWIGFGGVYSSLKFTQMMIRPKTE